MPGDLQNPRENDKMHLSRVILFGFPGKIGSEEILGVHLLGNPASELIIQAGMMIEDRRKLSDWKKYVFPHPTVGEIFREL